MDKVTLEQMFEEAEAECITAKGRLALHVCRLMARDAMFEDNVRTKRELLTVARGWLNSCMTADDKAINAEIKALADAANQKAAQDDLAKKLRAL